MINYIETNNMETLLKRKKSHKKPFQMGFTAFSWHELPKGILQISKLNQFINQFELANYGTSVKQLIISLIAYPNELKDLEEDKIFNQYDAVKQILDISVVLDYDFLLKTSELEAFEYEKYKVFQTLQIILSTFEIENFDTNRFLEDFKKGLDGHEGRNLQRKKITEFNSFEDFEVIPEDPRANIKQFGFTSFSWHEMPIEKLYDLPLKILLDENINLTDYGTSIKEFYTGFVAFPLNMSNSIEKWSDNEYFEDTKIFELGAVLDYDFTLLATVEEALENLKTCFLFSCQSILPTFNFPDFDTKRFLQDLKTVLEKED
jgi:hypothetical protein